MNILFDTNFLIAISPTDTELEEKYAKIIRLMDTLSYHFFVHPAQKNDFNRDQNIKRKKINLSHFNQYNTLEDPPIPTKENLKKLNWKETTPNDEVDNLLLFALKRNAVHILVTEDKEIHQKAKKADLKDRIYNKNEFLYFLESQVQPNIPPPYGIEEKPIYDLNPQAEFWDSLRESYPGFDTWFAEKAKEHRKAWCVCDTNNDPLAVCIYKEESELITDSKKTIKGKILKLCTFKVSHELYGRKFGERLLYTAFQYANKHHIDWVYLHAKDQHQLDDLCEDFGFYKYGTYRGDDVWIKTMKPPKAKENITPINFAKKYYPNYLDDEQINKFIVPIRPKYHNILFPDISEDTNSLFAKEFIPKSPESNTIKKAYLSNANTKQIKPGDILLFYRSNDRCSIQVIGIVEQTLQTQKIEETISLVSKRTVFSMEDLKDILKKPTLIILFRLAKIIKAIPRDKFTIANINGNIQTIRKIEHSSYLKLVSNNE